MKKPSTKKAPKAGSALAKLRSTKKTVVVYNRDAHTDAEMLIPVEVTNLAIFPTATAEIFTNLKAAAFRNTVEIVPTVDARFAELDKLITEAASVAPVAPEAKAPKAPKPAKSKFEGSGKKLADGTSWPAAGGWGSAERPYSSLISMQNDCRNYKRTLEQYREIGADGVAGPWIVLEQEVAVAAA